jgi:GDP-L-fucose synthase
MSSPRRKLDVERARREFGFTAEVQLEDGMRRTIGWYRGHHVAVRKAA